MVITITLIHSYVLLILSLSLSLSLSLDYFVSTQNPYYEKLVETMLKLQVDKDKDVRYFSAMAPNKFQKDSQDENDCQDTVSFFISISFEKCFLWSVS